MNILLAADGSSFSKKALNFILDHDELRESPGELVVLNVQSRLPPNVTRQLGKGAMEDYYREQATKVLQPLERLLAKRGVAHQTQWVVGVPDEAIVAAAKKLRAGMIVMGTHGYGLLGRIAMGSVAQRVVTDSPVPVLLVK